MNIISRSDLPTISALLAEKIANDISQAIADRGKACIALSGGSTPALTMQYLADKQLDWSKVSVTLSDERWLDQSNTRSNHRLLKENLLQSWAAQASFIPLYRAAQLNSQAIKQIENSLANFIINFDVCLLGMGEDGHFASLFPDSAQLEEGLRGESIVISVESPSVTEQRISMTLPFIKRARHIYLLIAGASKRSLIRKAIVTKSDQNLTLPISSLLEIERVNIYEAQQ